MMKVKSLGIFVGTAKCNANCDYCAGAIHRPYAEKKDGTPNLKRMKEVIEYCDKGELKSISISGSGEPILSPKSVTKVLKLIKSYNKSFKINLYTNGISLSKNIERLKEWKKIGLTHVYLSAHSSDENINANFLNIKKPNNVEKNINIIHAAGLSSRINFRMSKFNTPDIETFINNIEGFKKAGVNQVSCWCIRNDSDHVCDKLAPNKKVIEKIKELANTKYKNFIDFHYNNDKVYENKEKMTLFPDGTLSNKWCRT